MRRSKTGVGYGLRSHDATSTLERWPDGRRHTAAEAETLAYSLQKSGRAKVVGTHSAGQWYHTELFGLPADTGLQLVTARYINIDGQNLPSSGVQPDLVVEDEGKQEAAALSLLSGPK